LRSKENSLMFIGWKFWLVFSIKITSRFEK
jgi:hypothetical protein